LRGSLQLSIVVNANIFYFLASVSS
jgi:hypothetical protein